MADLSISKNDEITMRLVHYFVTKEDYQPVLVNGLDNEIWLENLDKPYEVIIINSNYIHNNEQLDFEVFKTKEVVKQIKKKTLSLSMNILNILLDVGENVDTSTFMDKHVTLCEVNDVKELSSGEGISEIYPNMVNDDVTASDSMDFFINVTNDINNKTEEKNEIYEHTFSKKATYLTYGLIAINVIVFLLQEMGILNAADFAMNQVLVKQGQWYRIFTSAFFHGSIIHILTNMYSLYVVGKEVETLLGKWKYALVYFISIITSSLLSAAVNGAGSTSIGASGAIFGLLGALLYFGYNYRLYIGNALIYEIIPVIAINLFIGFTLPYIDNFAHIGGLIGGYLSCMAVGIEGKGEASDRVNGSIVTALLIGFLTYVMLVLR